YLLALVWLGAGAVPALFSTENMPNAIRSILMLPAICMLAGIGASEALAYVKPPWSTAVLAVGFLGLCYEPFHTYFDVWATSPRVAEAFNKTAADNAQQILELPSTTPKYVVVVEPGAPIGIPPPTETVMFLTHSATPRQQDETNIHYIF